jgi:acyl-CoA thioesterase FadM
MDQVLGDTAAEAGVWGMTVHLELDYRGPLPVGEPLVLRGRVGESNGRKSLILGSIARAAAPDDVLVEARGLFVMPRREKLEAYFGRITDASGAPRTPNRAGDATAVPED